GVAIVALFPSMQADVIDLDESETGERREGQFIGLWSIAEKAAAAVGVGIAMALLDLAGYRPNVAQSPAVLSTLKVLYIGVPCLCNAIAFTLAMGYPLDRETHAAVLARLEARR